MRGAKLPLTITASDVHIERLAAFRVRTVWRTLLLVAIAQHNTSCVKVFLHRQVRVPALWNSYRSLAKGARRRNAIVFERVKLLASVGGRLVMV